MRFVLPVLLLLAGVTSLAFVPSELDAAREFEADASPVSATVLNVEQAGGRQTATEYHLTLAFVDDSGRQRTVEELVEGGERRAGDEIEIWVHGDEVHMDRDFSVYWYGPALYGGVGLALAFIGTVALIQAGRRR